MKRQEAVKAVKWFQREVGMAGWTVSLHIGGRCPASTARGMTPEEVAESYGLSLTDMRRHHIRIWVDVEKGSSDSQGRHEDPLVTLMHELMHGAFDEVGIDPMSLHEHLIDRLAHMLAERYRQKKER